MVSADVFYYSVAVCFAILVGFLAWVSMRIVKTLDKVDLILIDVKGITKDIDVMKNGVKMGLVSLVSAVVGRLKSPNKKEKGVKHSD